MESRLALDLIRYNSFFHGDPSCVFDTNCGASSWETLPAFEWNRALHSILLGTTLSFMEILPVFLILTAALLPGRLFLVLSGIAPCTRGEPSCVFDTNYGASSSWETLPASE